MLSLKNTLKENPKLLVIFGLLALLFIVTSLLQPSFRDPATLTNTMRWIGLYGIISIGVAFVIITGGIDLSIGSLIALSGVMLPMLLKGDIFFSEPLPVPLAFGLVLLISLGIGLFHGVLVTKLGLQPFLVTLCGLFIYRGLARAAGNDQTQGFGGDFEFLKEIFVKAKMGEWIWTSLIAETCLVIALVLVLKGLFMFHWWIVRKLASLCGFSGLSNRIVALVVRITGWVVGGLGGLYLFVFEREALLFCINLIPMSFVVLIIIGIIAAVVLNKTVFGRYLLAVGHNEEAAKFSGIKTDRVKIAAYMICSLLGGFAGMLFVLDTNGATPSSFGNFYELYAIAGAVLGGCSLRGGEGAIFGVICGAALVQVAEKAVFFLGVEEKSKFTVIGIFILAGVIADELFRRVNEKRMAGGGGTGPPGDSPDPAGSEA